MTSRSVSCRGVRCRSPRRSDRPASGGAWHRRARGCLGRSAVGRGLPDPAAHGIADYGVYPGWRSGSSCMVRRSPRRCRCPAAWTPRSCALASEIRRVSPAASLTRSWVEAMRLLHSTRSLRRGCHYRTPCRAADGAWTQDGDGAGGLVPKGARPAPSADGGDQPIATASSFGVWSSSTEAMTSPVVRSTACTLFAAGSVT